MSRALLEKLRDHIEAYMDGGYWPNIHVDLDEINTELAKPVPEPKCAGISRLSRDGGHYYIESVGDGFLPTGTKLYAEQQRLIPLTEDEVCEIASEILAAQGLSSYEFARAIEAAVAKANRLCS